jgi:hypothetical protein
VAERLSEIKDKLTEEEMSVFQAVLSTNHGARHDEVSLLEILRWWTLCGSSAKSFIAYLANYKLKCGQSAFAMKIFKDAMQSGNIAYTFNNPVKLIEEQPETADTRSSIKITTTSNIFSAHKVICTIPLNVLKDITFVPPLCKLKQEAISGSGNVNQMIKIHAEIDDPAWRSWEGMAWPGMGLTGAYGDGITPQGRAHVVSFGPTGSIDLAEKPAKAVQALRHMHPDMPLMRMVRSKFFATYQVSTARNPRTRS